MTLSTDSEKACHEIQYSFMIKTLNKLGRGRPPQLDKEHLQKTPRTNIIVNGEK